VAGYLPLEYGKTKGCDLLGLMCRRPAAALVLPDPHGHFVRAEAEEKALDSEVVEIPYLYTTHVIPPRKRSVETVTTRGRAQVRLQIASSGEMPVAMRICLANDDDRLQEPEERELSITRNMTEIRVLNGALYSSTEWNPMEGVSAEQAIADMSGTPFSEIQKNGMQLGRACEHSDIMGKVGFNDSEKRRAEIIEMAARIVICDGRFWTPSPEPCWVLDGRGHPSASLELIHEYHISRAGSQAIFRADEVKAVLEALNSGSENRGRLGKASPDLQGRVEVLLPDTLKLQAAFITLFGVIKNFLASERRDVHGYSRGAMLAYADLRDAFAAAEEGVVGETSMDLISAAVAMVAALNEPAAKRAYLAEALSSAATRCMGDTLTDLPPGPEM
jgi:hypothetical protein